MFKKMNMHILIFLLISMSMYSCQTGRSQGSTEILSPDQRNKITFQLEDGKPYYQVTRDDKLIINLSKMGFLLKDGDPLNQNFRIEKVKKSSFNENWTQVWGEQKNIWNHYNELRIQLLEKSEKPRKLNITFRMFDDGLGFRYEFPGQKHLKEFQIMDEITEFALAADNQVWWIPVYKYHRYEYLFQESPASQIDTVHTPLTMKTPDGLFLSIHEANLTDYAAMTLLRSDNYVLKCDLVPWSDGVKVKTTTPAKTPWRT
ncbi:MAG: glycoside hydrolase family 97 protein, partial [Calditrichae bacterium]|nr:glycoside hydrolase family 97 protein [Calditrichia bacterium]